MLNQQMIISTEILKAMQGTVGKIIGLSHGSDVADCVQSAATRAVAAFATFDATKGSLKTWLCTIAANEAKNWRKACANKGHDSEGFADDNGDCDQLVDTLQGSDGRIARDSHNNMQRIQAALATLPTDDREFIRLIYDGMTQVEAGARVGWSEVMASRKRKEIAAKMAKLLG